LLNANNNTTATINHRHRAPTQSTRVSFQFMPLFCPCPTQIRNFFGAPHRMRKTVLNSWMPRM
jgi:hypothetical protein